MKKVFASDFDGTLYFYKGKTPDEQLPPASVKKIQEYQKAGHLFGLCTGRQVGGLTPFIKDKFDPDFYITSSGSNIVDGKFREIQRRGIDHDVCAKIYDKVKARGDYWVTLDLEGVITVFDTIDDFPGKYNIISDINDLPEGLVHQFSVHTESESEAQSIVDEVNELFGDSVEAFRNVIEVDIAPKGCSKGKGVEVLRRHMGDCKLYGIGDSMNDLPLIQASDVSYTFPYAPKELQEQATKVVETIVDALEDSMNDED